MRSDLGTVCARLEAASAAPAVRLLDGPLGEESTLTRDELLSRGRAFAHLLRRSGVEPGDRVLTLLPTSTAFLVSLIGTWYAGAAFVPSSYARPRQGRGLALVRKLREIVAIAQPRAIIVTAQTLELLDGVDLPAVVTVLRDTDVLAAGATDLEPPTRPQPGSIALIQFTSGSTGVPRGAVIRHDQLVGHADAIGACSRVTAADATSTWLPLHHDMGFTGGLICPLVWGTGLHLMPTEAFVRNPASWLRSFGSHGATMTAAPPFALDLLAFRLGDSRFDGVDLSSWRYVVIGSEPIFEATLQAFRARFAPRGLNPRALKPCYGLAEATLAVTMTSADAGGDRTMYIDREALRIRGRVEVVGAESERAIAVVGCGPALPGFGLEIRDADGKVVGDSCQGRIWVQSEFVTQEYYGTDALPVHDGWLDTGDLGFVADGELYVSGREKDVIKRGGVSIQPQDVEWAASSVAGVRHGQTVAFSNRQDDKRREEIVVLVESRHRSEQEREELEAEVRSRVAADAGVQIDRVSVVARGSIPRTSSGKVQRQLAKQMYLEHRF